MGTVRGSGGRGGDRAGGGRGGGARAPRGVAALARPSGGPPAGGLAARAVRAPLRRRRAAGERAARPAAALRRLRETLAPGLLDQLVAERAVRPLLDQGEAGALVQAACVHQHVVGPQYDLFVAS